MQITDSHIVAANAAVFSLLSVVSNLFACQTFFYVHRLSMRMYYIRVSVQGVESLWGECRFIPADWGSQ